MSTFEDRYENAYSALRYAMECMDALKEILESGNCNDCAAGKTCQYRPGLGNLVRFNCPHYKKQENPEEGGKHDA